MSNDPRIDAGRQIWSLVSELSRVLHKRAQQRMLGSGLSIGSFEVMNLLIEEEEDDLRTSDVRRRLNVDPSVISTIATRLTDKNFVTKIPCDDDKRASFLKPTNNGIKAFREAEKNMILEYADITQKMPPVDWQKLQSIISDILLTLDPIGQKEKTIHLESAE